MTKCIILSSDISKHSMSWNVRQWYNSSGEKGKRTIFNPEWTLSLNIQNNAEKYHVDFVWIPIYRPTR